MTGSARLSLPSWQASRTSTIQTTKVKAGRGPGAQEQQGCGEGSRGPGKSGWLKDSDGPESARGGGSVRICRASLNGPTPKAAPSSHKSYARVQETPQEGESPAQAWSQVGEERLPGPRTQCQAKGPWSSLRSCRQVVSPFLVEEFPFRGKDGSVSPVETELGQLLRLQLDVVNLGSALGCRPDIREKDGTQLGQFHLSRMHQ